MRARKNPFPKKSPARKNYPPANISYHPKKRENEKNAAILIQRLIRGKQTRSIFDISPLPKDEASTRCSYLMGNDPEIRNLAQHIPDNSKKIGLLAISSLRSISIACQFSLHGAEVKTIVADNSLCVQQIWRSMFAYAEKHDDIDSFLANLQQFIDENIDNITHFYPDAYKAYDDDENPTDTSYNNQTNLFYPRSNIYMYFKLLFETHGFTKVRSVILNTGFILQNWENPELFNTANNLFEFHGISDIAVYASNLIQCTEDETDRINILSYIDSFKPFFVIHSNLDENLHYPSKLYLLPQPSLLDTITTTCEDMPELVKNIKNGLGIENDAENSEVETINMEEESPPILSAAIKIKYTFTLFSSKRPLEVDEISDDTLEPPTKKQRVAKK